MSFLDLTTLGLTTSSSELANLALGYLQAQIPGYTPSPGNMEVIVTEALSLIAEDTSQNASVVPSAIWRAFGTKIAGIPYLQGASAITQVTFTVADTAGYQIDALTGITLNGFGFSTQQDLTIPPGSNSGTVTVAAANSGTLYNGVGNPVQLVSQITVPVTGMAALSPSYGGVDQEDDPSYQNRLVVEMQLQAPRPITAADYQLMAVSFPPAAGTDQQEVGRATAIDGYSPASTAFTANTTSGSATLAAVSSFAGISIPAVNQPGSIITGPGIPVGTTVLSVNIGASTLVLSQNATATATAAALTSQGSYGNARQVAVWVTAADGTALNSDTITAVAAWFASYREVNFIVNVLSPTYTPVYVTASVHPYVGIDHAMLQTAVQQAILSFLSPLMWGQPRFGNQPRWFNEPWVRVDKLIATIQNVPGVDYVPAGGVTLGLSASPSGTGDLLLPGPAPMPTSTTITVPVPTLV